MYMVMFILDEQTNLDAVLQGWQRAGAVGVTINESRGIGQRVAQAGQIPPFQSLEEGTDYMEGHYTLFAIVPDETTVHRCLHAAEEIVGDLETPHSGILAAWPITLLKGVPRALATENELEPPEWRDFTAE